MTVRRRPSAGSGRGEFAVDLGEGLLGRRNEPDGVASGRVPCPLVAFHVSAGRGQRFEAQSIAGAAQGVRLPSQRLGGAGRGQEGGQLAPQRAQQAQHHGPPEQLGERGGAVAAAWRPGIVDPRQALQRAATETVWKSSIQVTSERPPSKRASAGIRLRNASALVR